MLLQLCVNGRFLGTEDYTPQRLRRALVSLVPGLDVSLISGTRVISMRWRSGLYRVTDSHRYRPLVHKEERRAAIDFLVEYATTIL